MTKQTLNMDRRWIFIFFNKVSRWPRDHMEVGGTTPPECNPAWTCTLLQYGVILTILCKVHIHMNTDLH